jgi:CelD/BcsL family acetyltransferase involved in cellulose biosynthesis
MYSRSRMTVSWQVLDSVEAVEPAVADWDRFAVERGLPYCAPAFLLAWWKHASPEGAELRVVVVKDDQDHVVGIGPFHSVRERPGLETWSLLATDLAARIEPLAATPEAEAAIAEAVAPAAKLRLDGLPTGSPWPDRLGGPKAFRHQLPPTPAPYVPLEGHEDADAFLGSRSSNFRQQMRRARRKFEKDGGTFRIASTRDEIERDLKDFERLHLARWDWRGGSDAIKPGVGRMLAEAGEALAPSGRFQLMSLEIEGKVICSQLFLGAGTEVTYWNGGFDDDYASYKPSLIALVEAVRLSIESGAERFDLGPGAQDYKYRFSDTEDQVVWQTVIPRGSRYPLARATLAPQQAKRALADRLSDERKEKLKRLIRRS